MIQEQSKLPSKAEQDALWEQRRYEIAKAVCNGIYARLGLNAGANDKLVAGVAIGFADELIKQLKVGK